MTTTYMTSPTDPMAQGLVERYTAVNKNVVINVQDDDHPPCKPEVILIEDNGDNLEYMGRHNQGPNIFNLSRSEIIVDLDAEISATNDMDLDSSSDDEPSHDDECDDEDEASDSDESDSGMEIDYDDETTTNRRNEALAKERAAFRTAAIQAYKSFDAVFTEQVGSGMYRRAFTNQFIKGDLSTCADVAKFFFRLCTTPLSLGDGKVLSVEGGACYSEHNKAHCPRGKPELVDEICIYTLQAFLQQLFPPLRPSETDWHPQAMYEEVNGKSSKAIVYDGLKAKFLETGCGHFTMVEFIWLLNHFDNFVVKKDLKTGKSIDLIQLALDTQPTATSCNFTDVKLITRRVLIAVLTDKTDFEASEEDLALLQGDVSEEEQAQYNRLAATFPDRSVPEEAANVLQADL